jgi:hypothetical protein
VGGGGEAAAAWAWPATPAAAAASECRWLPSTTAPGPTAANNVTGRGDGQEMYRVCNATSHVDTDVMSEVCMWALQCLDTPFGMFPAWSQALR